MSDDDFGSSADPSNDSSFGSGFGDGSVTEVTSQSWFGRIANSLMGMLIGGILFVVAFPLLFWNEGRAVHRAQDLEEGQTGATVIDPQTISPNFEGKLVFAAGTATTEETLKDPEFGISAGHALRLQRTVEMYLWKESEHKETHKKLGGGEETRTTYSYSKTWSDSPIDSSRFHNHSGHVNPPQFPYPKRDALAEVITLGAFEVPAELKGSFHNAIPVTVTTQDLEQLPEDLRSKFVVQDGQFFLGRSPSEPAIGDVRIGFTQVPEGPCGLIGVQSGKTFSAYVTRGGRSLFELRTGKISKEEFFMALTNENNVLTWVLRAVGFALMLFGLILVFNPLSVLADIIPFLGTFVSYGTGFIAFLLAISLSLATIAAGWIAYRPVLGIGLLVVSGSVFLFLIYGLANNRRPSRKLSPA